MPFVNEIEETQADPQLRGIYGNIEQNMGFLPHYFKALGAMPQAIEGQLHLNAAILTDGALSRIEKEQIGVVVSGINASSYCLVIHMELLRRLGVEKSLARKLVNDYEHAAVPDNVKALFRFADKLTRKPVEIEDEDIQLLKKAGWDEAAVRETVLTVAYFNYVNRVSLGLGLVEDFE
ncbi:MAG: peroxidase-related enzyme [Candidatus Acidiferrales bacterium]